MSSSKIELQLAKNEETTQSFPEIEERDITDEVFEIYNDEEECDNPFIENKDDGYLWEIRVRIFLSIFYKYFNFY